MRECKSLEVKNDDTLVEADLLLLVTNSAITSFLTSHFADS